MKKYWTRGDLYLNVDSLMSQLGYKLTLESYPLSSKDIAQNYCYNLYLEEIEFQKTDICGILVKGRASTSIALNKKRDKAMQNFDCMHELIHYFLHDISYSECIYSESKPISQNRIIEWQANEGAAQALVPYQLFIPEYVSLSKKYARDFMGLYTLPSTLAKMFNVTSKVIQNRINNLEYEIYQYMCGTPINEINVLSKKKAKEYGVHNYIAHYNYCTNCLGIVDEKQQFCHICGSNLQDISPEEWLNTKLHGVGYMIYPGWPLDSNGRVTYCPKCQNQEVNTPGDLCKICSAPLINRCAGEEDCDLNGNTYYTKDPCNIILDGNARYCTLCGCESTFYQNNLLLPWEEEKKQIESQSQPTQNWSPGEF